MTPPLFLIGLGAGVASALLYVAILSGSMLGLFLALLAPLPILIAGLGWRHIAGLIGALTAVVLILMLGAPMLALGFLLSIGLPSWWFAYLALLARQDQADGPTEWYPIGRLVIWVAIVGAALISLTILLAAGDLESYRATLREAFLERMQAAGVGVEQLPPGQDLKKLADLVAVVTPIIAAAHIMILSIANLWIAGRVCRASNRLVRPWPELSRVELPRGAGLGFGATILGSFLPGVAGLVAEIFSTTFGLAFMLQGLAVMHVTTQVSPARGLLLFALYVTLPFTGVFVAGLGVAEQVFGLRRRFGPPPGGPPIAAA